MHKEVQAPRVDAPMSTIDTSARLRMGVVGYVFVTVIFDASLFSCLNQKILSFFFFLNGSECKVFIFIWY